MINNLAFITGRESGAFMPKLAREAVDVVRPSTILPKLNVSIPKETKIAQAVYTSPYASIGDLAEKSAIGKKLDIAM